MKAAVIKTLFPLGAVLALGFFVFRFIAESDTEENSGEATCIKIPRDESAHSEPIEWWYYTGTLQTADGENYGFEMVVFQHMKKAKPFHRAHFAITDLKRDKFCFDAKRSPEAGVGAKEAGFNFQIGDWHISGHAGEDEIFAAMDEYAIDLRLSAQKPMVAASGTGRMTWGSISPFFFHYYSYTRMAVTGKLTVCGVEKSVKGQAWMDHQWGSVGRGFAGWDWISLRLDDFSEVILYVVRRGEESRLVLGSFIDKDGGLKKLSEEDVRITATGIWESPHSQAKYPQGWTIQVPEIELDVKVVSVMADQEILAVPGPYWEGLCEVSGKRRAEPIGGYAYVELFGYR